MFFFIGSKEATMLAIQPTLCGRCAQHGRTCCQGREIYITPGDLRRISAVTGELQFVEWSRTQDSSYMDQDDDPVWRQHVFASDGSRRILKRQANGDCIFLSSDGCLLALAARPLLCRLHPFTYTADHIDIEPDPDCPRHLLVSGESVFEAIHTSMALAQQWHRQLYEEVLIDDNDYRTDLRPSL
jgi:Fe-S-cluster containining protein